MDSVQNQYPRVVTLRQWAQVVQAKTSLAYELSRKDGIPGMFRIGHQIRINMDEFFAQTKAS